MDKPDPRLKLSASPVALAGGKRRRLANAPTADETAGVRVTRLITSGIWQAVRLPEEFRLPGTEARIWRDGNRLIVEPLEPAATSAERDGRRRPTLAGPIGAGPQPLDIRPKKLRP